jgi:glycosyltransferase involved in cell wall biosynthesis
LAAYIEGDALQPIWNAPLTPGATDGSSDFKVHTVFTWNSPCWLRRVRELAFYLREGIRLLRRRRYDAVVAFGTTKTALAGFLLARLFGIKFLIEVSIRLERLYGSLRPRPTLRERWQGFRCRLVSGLLLAAADRLHLMYPGQVNYFRATRRVPQTAFPDFVPIASLSATPHASQPRTILSLGTPLYLKGADLVIRAFLRLADDFPDVRLVVAGQAHDERYFQDLAESHPRIRLVGHVEHGEALNWIASAIVVVIASRTDAMPRVAVEAMALARPIIATRVDGLAAYLIDGENSLLVPPGDTSSLEQATRRILADPSLAAGLGARAQADARARFSEAAYTRAFVTMLRETIDERR